MAQSDFHIALFLDIFQYGRLSVFLSMNHGKRFYVLNNIEMNDYALFSNVSYGMEILIVTLAIII